MERGSSEGRGGIRGLGTRGESANLRAAFRDTGAARATIPTAAKAMRAADMVAAKVERHHEKHREAWTTKRYEALLLKAGPTRSPSPTGTVRDAPTALMNRAQKEVSFKLTQRLGQVTKIRDTMLKGAALRPTRNMKWGKGLGE